jgi:hypothetical protein
LVGTIPSLPAAMKTSPMLFLPDSPRMTRTSFYTTQHKLPRFAPSSHTTHAELGWPPDTPPCLRGRYRAEHWWDSATACSTTPTLDLGGPGSTGCRFRCWTLYIRQRAPTSLKPGPAVSRSRPDSC